MSREIKLDNWLCKSLGTAEFKRLPLAGDASFRKYYRVQLKDFPKGASQDSSQGSSQDFSKDSSFKGSSFVLMDAPPPEIPDTFVKVAAILQKQSISVPKICAFDIENGFLLLSDFGDNLYSKSLNQNSAPLLYQDAIDTLLKIQQCEGEVPLFDKKFMNTQLNVFKEWYLEKHLALELNAEISQTLEALSERLFEVISEQPIVFVHQDYHSRNLMILEQNGPGVLDFQDAIKGPISYDVVSLFQDAYITWPRQKIELWVLEYQEKAKKLGLLSRDISADHFLRWMDLTGLQRHLKNLGVFTRLNYRDGKKQYLNDMPRLQNYIHETYERYSELHPYEMVFKMIRQSTEAKQCAQ